MENFEDLPVLKFTLEDKTTSIESKLRYIDSEIKLLELSLSDIDSQMTNLDIKREEITDILERVTRVKRQLEENFIKDDLIKKLSSFENKEILYIYKYVLDNDPEKIDPDQENKHPKVIIYKLRCKGYKTEIDEYSGELNIYLKYDRADTYSYDSLLYEYSRVRVTREESIKIKMDAVIYLVDECPKKYLDIIEEIKNN